MKGTLYRRLVSSVRNLADVRFAPILLQKSFCITEYKFSGP
jgi:hypothetical protein